MSIMSQYQYLTRFFFK